MVEDRFYEPNTIPFDELVSDAYEEYLENFEPDEENEEPMTYEQYEEYYWQH